MSRAISVSAASYPSDKSVFDMILAQRISARKLQEFLRDRGVFYTGTKKIELANIVCDLILDYADFQSLLSFSNTKESRIKTSQVILNVANTTIEELSTALGDLSFGAISPDEKVKLPSALQTPILDKDAGQIHLEQSFKTVDYGKTSLLQEQDHVFSVKVKEVAAGKFEVIYSTSSFASEICFRKILETLKATSKDKTGNIHEVEWGELSSEEWGKFFDKLLLSTKSGLSLISVSQVKLQRPDARAIDTDEDDELSPEDQARDEDDTDLDSGNETEEGSMIKSVTMDGRDLLNHKSVKEWRDQGYGVIGVKGLFSFQQSPSSLLHIEIQTQFNKTNKFQCEIIRSWQISTGEKGRDVRHLPAVERELILKPLHDEAFSIYNELRELKHKSGETVGTKVIPVQTAITT